MINHCQLFNMTNGFLKNYSSAIAHSSLKLITMISYNELLINSFIAILSIKPYDHPPIDPKKIKHHPSLTHQPITNPYQPLLTHRSLGPITNTSQPNSPMMNLATRRSQFGHLLRVDPAHIVPGQAIPEMQGFLGWRWQSWAVAS